VQVLLIVVASVLMLVGLVGTVIPGVPDVFLILAGAVVLVARDGFTTRDVWLLVGLALIATAAEGLVYLAAGFGAKKGGASRKGVVGALLGGVLGLFIFPPWGILLGPLVGAVVAELVGGARGKAAMKAGLGASVGVVGGAALKFAAGVTMIGLAVLVTVL